MLSVHGSRELRAAVLAVKVASRDLRKELNRVARETMSPVWQRAVAENITWAMETRVLMPSTLIKAGNPPVLQGAGSRRKVGRSIIPTSDWPGFEYGGDPSAYSRYERRNRTSGGYHVVERRTMRHLRRRSRSGYVFGPAVREVVPRLASLWVQTVVRTYMNALDQKG